MAELEERVGKLENKVTALETAQPYLKDILNRTTMACESMSDAVDSLKTTLVKMDAKIDAQGKKIDSQGEDIKALTDKVESVEDKGKFDILEWVKANWIWLAITATLGIAMAQNYLNI